ncbi:hypothetical protein DL766_008272 [Monosporascus sp. MC13-8B]|nr:hypothetical protein DL763_007148 [Monosporascus cannonballus]RYP20136.1 hypothetical protein DL766_008272 [Monosporascus sp. MC13-8B]
MTSDVFFCALPRLSKYWVHLSDGASFRLPLRLQQLQKFSGSLNETDYRRISSRTLESTESTPQLLDDLDACERGATTTAAMATMDPSRDFKSFQEKIQTALIAATRTTNQLAAEDLSFQKTSNPDVEERLDETNGHFLSLASSLVKAAAKGTELRAPELEDADDIDLHWSRIVDVVDTLLEKADTCLDEYTGLIKRKSAPTEETGPAPKKPKSLNLDHSIRRANILKPQDKFGIKPDNLDSSPWKPILTRKPHAIVPLEQSLGTFNDENQTIQHKHPYETEILNLQYPEHVYQIKEPIKFQPIESTAATYVDTFEGVLEMLEELKRATEIAIDTEHHDFRTYSGLLSLMQISTREKDWIIDTLQPWRRKLEVLNEVFADPRIVKVLQGAYMDILWLQRDCGLYIVGLFDTYEAAVSLGYPGRGLAYLLKRFVDFDADKKYQLADWRIRPIPEEMFYYARSDTHYLLYIYDMIRNELLEKSDRNDPEKDLVSQVLDRSKETSLRRYEKIVYDAEGGQGPYGWYNLLIRQSSGTFTKEQFAVFRAVHKWRDDIARREDEDPLFILPNATLFDIARRLPPDPKALHGTFGHHTSYIAKRAVADLFQVITKAKAEGVNGPSVVDVLRSNSTTSTMAIGAVAQSVFPQLRSSDNQKVLETKELVSDKSRLWGEVALSSRWEEGSAGANKPAQSLCFALPWAHMLEDATIGTEQRSNVAAAAAAEAAEMLNSTSQEQPNGAEEADGEFTLKAGLGRKTAQSESDSECEDEEEGGAEASGTPQAAEEVFSLDSDAERAAKKKAKKEEKKARKKARAEAKKARKEAKAARRTAKKKGAAEKAQESAEDDAAEEGEEEEEEQDEQPFDYTQARSVLHAKRSAANGTAAGAGAKGAARFNPYTNAMMTDGPKPARRMHGEKAGKSFTFKK